MSTATKKKEDAKVAAAAAADGAPKKKGKKKVLLLVLIVLLVAGGAAWFFLFRGGGEAEAAVEPEPVLGEVLPLEAISINLADGHYLRIGVALQVIEGPAHPPDGSEALDLTIQTFSGRTVTELADNAVREELKVELTHKVEEAYHHDVVEVYFTEFVTQ